MTYTANIQTARADKAEDNDLLALVRDGDYVEDEETVDGDGDVYWGEAHDGFFYAATFTDDDETIFVVCRRGLAEEDAFDGFVNESVLSIGGADNRDAYMAHIDAEVDAYIEARQLERAGLAA